MDSYKVETTRRQVAELNRRFRSRQLVGEAFYAQLMQQGFDCARCVLMSLVPDGSNTYFGKIVRQDGRVFEFDIDLDEPGCSSWTDITERFEQQLHRARPWSPERAACDEFVRQRDAGD